MWLTLGALVVMGAADQVSVVIRLSLVQLATPDDMRGRVSAINFLFVNASNQLGEFESGVTAAWWGAVPATHRGRRRQRAHRAAVDAAVPDAYGMWKSWHRIAALLRFRNPPGDVAMCDQDYVE